MHFLSIRAACGKVYMHVCVKWWEYGFKLLATDTRVNVCCSPAAGAWRWYSETMLECCVSIAYVKEFGITFDQFECLAMCNSLTVQSTRADEGSVEDFRSTVQRVLSHDNGTLLVASYDRGVLGQTVRVSVNGVHHFAANTMYNFAASTISNHVKSGMPTCCLA